MFVIINHIIIVSFDKTVVLTIYTLTFLCRKILELVFKTFVY